MSDQSHAEQLARAIVLECCPKHLMAAQATTVGGPSIVGASFDWAKLLAVLKVILPVILDLLSHNANPIPSPSPEPSPTPVPHPVP